MTTASFTDEQEQLGGVLRRLLADTCANADGRLERDLAVVRPQLGAALAATGMSGLPFPEELGGAGAGLAETALLFHEGGRALGPSSVYTTLLAGLAIQRLAVPRVREHWIPRLAAGELVAGVALWSPDDARLVAPTVEAVAGPEGLRLRGTAWFVENALIADAVVVAATGTGTGAETGAETGAGTVTVAIVRPDAGHCRVDAVAAMGRDPLGHLVLDDYRVPAADLIGDVPLESIGRLAEAAVALQCLEMVGGATRVLDDTVAYVKQREQFGRPIGSFQAVQHIVADVRIAIDVARLTAWRAVATVAAGRPAARETAIAKLHANRAYPRATLQCHQLMGGMGYVRDCDLHLWSERAKVSELRNGSAQVALGWLADATGREVGA